MSGSGVTASTFHDWLVEGRRLTVLDIRDRTAAERWRIEAPSLTYVHLPQTKVLAASVQDRLDELIDDHDMIEPIVVVCARGEASAEVATTLAGQGIEAVNLTDGMRGWSELLVARSVPSTGTLVQFERPSSGCLSYLAVAGDDAAVVDPLDAFTDRYIRAARERDATLRWAIDTHVHADHVSGVRTIARETDATPALPAGAQARGLAFDALRVEDGRELAVGDRHFLVLSAPGHTSEHQIFRWGETIMTGDLLFLDGVGRPDLEADDTRLTAYARELYETLQETVLPLPEDLIVAPGHTRPGAQRHSNGALVGTLGTVATELSLSKMSKEAFIDRVTEGLPERPANYERLIEINLGRETVDAETGRELELGPNNCAVAMAATE
ncbi:MAG: MBL fold metallo-hydrolase [Halobacteriaceae archaeon]